ncbi:kinetochore complex Sim4 subunit Fta1-domain-containing protein [Neurospora hispaniola]|uniref:Kinetochore complex Sim4 subunit Fta1-domain-containing protein n=1 Tax=Neurospora hispaniola TaxID=588809 RepID=A0AAJ0HY15_9PEZI|nr:kinetochore complex Sim4 subunit Fta1-domain-containing protein [Neurospora hispaniola]
MRIPPPDVLAQWPTPNYVNPESRGPGLTIIELIMLPLSLMFLGLRLYVRGRLLRKTGWDDWFMIIASIFGTTVSICVILAYTTFGWDKHIWDLTVTEVSHGRKISMATQAVFIMSSCFSKVSILVSYLALAPMNSWFRRLTKVSMVFIIAMNCGSFILLFTQCHPVSSYWSLIQSDSADCIQEYAPLMTHAIVTALADFIVWVLPLPTFFRAHIPIHQRIILVVLFSFGLLVVFAACIRMYWVHYVVWETWDPTWEGNQLWAWTAVEIHLGIMCGCVPYFKSLFRFWKGKTSRRGTSNKGTSQSWAGSRRDGGGAGVGGSSKIGDEQQRQGQNSRVEVRKVISFSSERSEEPLSPAMGTACTVSVDGVEEIELQEKRTSAFSTVSREVEDQKGGHAHQGEWGFEFDGARGVQHSKSLSAESTFGNKTSKMPPPGRKRQRVETEPEPEPEPELRRSSTSPNRQSSPEILEQEESRPPFYNTTFSTHRVSPLYVGKQPLDRERLRNLSQRLREILVGDVVRGVEVGLGRADGEDGVMGRAGALEYVDIRWVNMGAVLDITSPETNDSEGEHEDATPRTDLDWPGLVSDLKDKKALHILLRYETAECTALLLPSSSDQQQADPPTNQFTISNSQPTDPPNPAHFLHLPLLLLRMPAPLKSVISDFLSTTFDCRVSSLRLGTRSLVQSWESWIRTAGLPEKGPLAKDVVLNLGFYIPPPDNKGTATNATPAAREDKEGPPGQEPLGIKGIDVIIPAADVRGFVRAGKQMQGDKEKEKEKGKGKTKEKQTWQMDVKKRRKLAGRLGEEGWEWRTAVSGDNQTEESPFTEALGRYVDKHLGLNLFHPGVRVTKVACGGFAMSEGRLKVFAPREEGGQRQRAAVWKLVSGLVGKAEGGKALV